LTKIIRRVKYRVDRLLSLSPRKRKPAVKHVYELLRTIYV